MIKPYPKKIETQMQELYNRLPEKSRRLYAGVEALKLPFGGITYIAVLFGCSRDTVSLGVKELAEAEKLPKNRNREEGGGRKSALGKKPEIKDVFLRLLKEHTAGDPMDETKKWTNLTCAEIVCLLAKEGFRASRNIVRKLLKNNGYVKRKALKKKRLVDMWTVTPSSCVSPN